jgi:hypothetical protein
MIDFAEIERQSQIVTDSAGNRYVQVQIPVDAWEQIKEAVSHSQPEEALSQAEGIRAVLRSRPAGLDEEVEALEMSQKDRIMAVIRSWEDEKDEHDPEDSQAWADEFMTFVRENRFDLTRKNSKLDLLLDDTGGDE